MAVRNCRRTDSPGTQTVLSQSIPTASFALGKKFRGEAKRYGRGNGRGVPSCLERRSERLWRGRLYRVAPESFRGRLLVRKGRREAGKCDNLSFLRMCLSQMDKVLGNTKSMPQTVLRMAAPRRFRRDRYESSCLSRIWLPRCS